MLTEAMLLVALIGGASGAGVAWAGTEWLVTRAPEEVRLLSHGAGDLALAAQPIVPHLQKVSQGVGAKLSPKANARWEPDVKGKAAVFSNAAIWLDDVRFSERTIEVDILGKSQPRGSNFLGIAFHCADETTFDCVYFGRSISTPKTRTRCNSCRRRMATRVPGEDCRRGKNGERVRQRRSEALARGRETDRGVRAIMAPD